MEQFKNYQEMEDYLLYWKCKKLETRPYTLGNILWKTVEELWWFSVPVKWFEKLK